MRTYNKPISNQVDGLEALSGGNLNDGLSNGTVRSILDHPVAGLKVNKVF
jgi:hypothetical protein